MSGGALPPRPLRDLGTAAGGAVYVEFLVALLPMLVFFECLVQLAGLHTANIVVKHAATTAVRAAMVVLHDDPKYYGGAPLGSASGKRRDDIQRAALIPLRAVRSIVSAKVSFPTAAGGDDDKPSFGRDEMVRVKVAALYRCRVPLASTIVCGWAGVRKLTGEAALPNQGADYAYPSDDGSGGGP